jgi:glycosyltransferase involved in cell wall biosynthesis
LADTPNITIVVPCYNEAKRLAIPQFRSFLVSHPEVRFLFVNDGSRDNTLEVLNALVAEDPRHYEVLDLEKNGGKAEAVRRGMVKALAEGANYAGYWDADLATPLAEIPRFVDTLETHRERDVVFGSRVRLLGRAIARRALRHYLGRLFATVASFVLDLPVYDTQCGAKMFRSSDEARTLFATRFNVNWTFDVEVIARLQRSRLRAQNPRDASSCIYELPLNEWHDVAGSKVRPKDFFKAFFEMLLVYRMYGRGSRRALG